MSNKRTTKQKIKDRIYQWLIPRTTEQKIEDIKYIQMVFIAGLVCVVLLGLGIDFIFKSILALWCGVVGVILIVFTVVFEILVLWWRKQ